MSKKSSTFVSDLGIVPSATITNNRDMNETCIFRVQFAGDMWRVMESSKQDEAKRFNYRILHKRRVIESFRRMNGQRAIVLCLIYALGCDVNVNWETVL